MAAYPGAKQIVVQYAFPNDDPTKQPYVTNATTEVDEIAASNTSIEWSLSGGHQSVHPAITGISFYSDRAKTRPVTPPFFVDAGRNWGAMNWVILFSAAAVPSETALYYTLHFKDDRFSNLNWDPTVKIKPRTAAEGAAGAGGH